MNLSHLSSDFVSTDNQDYVFAQIKEVGTGSASPLYTDSVARVYKAARVCLRFRREGCDVISKGQFFFRSRDRICNLKVGLLG